MSLEFVLIIIIFELSIFLVFLFLNRLFKRMSKKLDTLFLNQSYLSHLTFGSDVVASYIMSQKIF